MLDRDARLIIDELLSPEAKSRQFAAGARELLADTDETNRTVLGRIPRSKTWVDGTEGAALETVRPDGIIVREYELVIDALLYIGAELERNSAVGTGSDKRPGHPGFFRKSHVLFADGQEVAMSATIPDAGEYVFLSDAPYARRLERRYSLYESTAAKAGRRFGNIARISFGWRSPLLSYVAGGSNRAERAALRQQPARQAAMRMERSTRLPAIIVNMGR